jgi:hypothetical protein
MSKYDRRQTLAGGGASWDAIGVACEATALRRQRLDNPTRTRTIDREHVEEGEIWE